jgi:F420-dependent oxidoreductase-like protein
MELAWMVGVQENLSWGQLVDVAHRAEAEHYDALFRSDHYLPFVETTERGALDTWSLLAALSLVTKRIRLGSLVSPVTFRHPSQLAKVVTTVDHTSGGRVELGLGAGWFEDEHTAYGFPLPPPGVRMAMLEEQLEILHRLWDRAEPAVTFRGAHYRLTACCALPKPIQAPRPPIIVGGNVGPRSVGVGVRWADEYNLLTVDPAACRRHRATLAAACEAIGRDPADLRVSALTPVVIGEDERDLRRRTTALLRNLGRDDEARAFLDGLGSEWVVGTQAQVSERLAEYADSGIDRLIAQTMTFDLDAMSMIAAALE